MVSSKYSIHPETLSPSRKFDGDAYLLLTEKLEIERLLSRFPQGVALSYSGEMDFGRPYNQCKRGDRCRLKPKYSFHGERMKWL